MALRLTAFSVLILIVIHWPREIKIKITIRIRTSARDSIRCETLAHTECLKPSTNRKKRETISQQRRHTEPSLAYGSRVRWSLTLGWGENMLNAMLDEYKALRAEAMVTYNRRAAVQNVGTALFAGLQAAAFMRGVPELSIGATMLILAFYHDDIRWVEAGAKIGAYIRNIIEPKIPGLQWETISQNIADSQRQTPTLYSRLARLSSRYPMTVIIGCFLAVTCLFCSKVDNTPRVWLNLAFIAISMVWGIRLFILATDWGLMRRRWNDKFSEINTESNQ